MIEVTVPLILVGSTRAGDIVRDKDILRLYKKVGAIRFLLGIEAYSDESIAAIKKGGSVSEDRQAIALLRTHGIVSMVTYVVGFQEERDADYWRSFDHLCAYDPDRVQLIYAMPYRWNPFYHSVQDRRIVQADTTQWDYKHQVLEMSGVPIWRHFSVV